MRSKHVPALFALVVAAVGVAAFAWPASSHAFRSFRFFESFSGGYGVDVDANAGKRRVGDGVSGLEGGLGDTGAPDAQAGDADRADLAH